jgi:hypothetical protein
MKQGASLSSDNMFRLFLDRVTSDNILGHDVCCQPKFYAVLVWFGGLCLYDLPAVYFIKGVGQNRDRQGQRRDSRK